jgi:cysteine desulfurase
MLVNNETGALQPVADIAKLVGGYARAAGRRILMHTDAVQAFGKMPLDCRKLGVDALSVSSHKIAGPRGVGALFLEKRISLEPIFRGGEQERGLRPGTENLQGVHGFASAAAAYVDRLAENHAAAVRLMDYLIEELSAVGGVRILPEERIGARSQFYSPYILKMALPPVPGEVLVRALGQHGICVSTGSACSSRSKERHRVLANMGVSDELAASSIRISTGPTTTQNEADRFLEVLKIEGPRLARIAGSGSGTAV